VSLMQSIVVISADEAPQPLGSVELQVDHPIVYRSGPINRATTSVLSPARWVSSQIAYGPKLVPGVTGDDPKEGDPPKSADCPFCYPGTDFLQDPRFQWSEALWCEGPAHYPLGNRVPLYVGVHPAYYLRYHQVLFRTDHHPTELKHLLPRKPEYFHHFLLALRDRAQALARRVGSSSSETLIGGVSFALSWPHFHFNMGTCPSWVPQSFAFGEDYWRSFSIASLKEDLVKGNYQSYAHECRLLPRFPSTSDLIIDDSDAYLWLSSFGGRSEHECVIFLKERRAISALTDSEIDILSNALWNVLCYYRSIGPTLDVNGFLMAFHSQMNETASTPGGGRLVFEIMPLRKLGYLEVCHGCYILDDWPENVAARLRGFKALALYDRVPGPSAESPPRC
jgi:hypothetical protein